MIIQSREHMLHAAVRVASFTSFILPELREPERIGNVGIWVDFWVSMEVLDMNCNLVAGRNDDPVRQLASRDSKATHYNYRS